MRRALFLVSLCSLLCLAAGGQIAAAAQTVMVFGDSLSAGYGLDAGSGWVALLTMRLQTLHAPDHVVNASVSGETTAGGLARLPDALRRTQPTIVLIELGGNDGLRGQSLEAMRSNLAAMIDLSRRSGAKPVLFEMSIPSNYGPVYSQSFTQSFAQVAAAGKIPLVPFFLHEIIADRSNFQQDGIHPVAAAQPQMLDAVWPTLLPLLSPSAASH